MVTTLKVISCPLAVTADATMSLLNEVAEAVGPSSFVVPVLIFPDMEPDESISNRAERSNVYLVWGRELLLNRLAEIAREVGVRKPPFANDIRREVEVITDGQIDYRIQPNSCDGTGSGGNPAKTVALSTGPDLVIPHLRRVQVRLALDCGHSTSNREVRNM